MPRMPHSRPHPDAAVPRLSRRGVLGAGSVGALGLTLAGGVDRASATDGSLDGGVRRLERTHGATIALAATNLGTGATLLHRADQRQPMCSTFKPIVTAALLRQGIDLEEVVRYRRSDVVDYSPISGERRAMSYAELADAAIRFSDNTAGNLLLRGLGGAQGPRELTRFLRSIGDDVTRLDRWETELNEGTPGDPRDTTTPRALARTYRRLLCGPVLQSRDRWLLRAWMEANTTSLEKFRDGLPDGWWCADKTGGGSYGVMNDAGMVISPGGTEIVFAVLSRASRTDPDAVGSATLMRDVARLVVGRLGAAER